MKGKNKFLVLLLAFVMVISVATGCGVPKTEKKATTETKETTTTEKEETKTAEATPASDEKITLRIVDWSDSSAELRKKFHEQYMNDHPNVTIEYTTLTIDQFKSSVVTAIKSGDAPDLFPIPAGMTLSSAIKEEWYQPMDDLMPAEFWGTLEESVLLEGIATLEGKHYTIPEVQPITSGLIYYNQDVLDAAGVTELPKTYTEFLAVCKQITAAGAGQFYGMIEGGKQINRMYTLVQSFSNVAGAQVPPFSKALTVDGRVNFDSDAVKGTFALFNQLYKDGSLHPDTINLSAPEAREYFAQGQAAFIMQGNWCVSTWDATYPDMNYGVMAVPTPDDGAKGALDTGIPGPWMGIYSQSKHPQAAAEYLQALYSYTEGYTYQKDLVETAGQLSIVKGYVDQYLANEHAVEYYNLAKEVCLPIPYAEIGDVKVYDFYANVVDVQPSFGALFQGMISGGLDDYEGALTTLSDALTTEWKRAADAAGVDFGALDFPNWDPMKAYSTEDYEAAK